jgi:hypothetical protein
VTPRLRFIDDLLALADDGAAADIVLREFAALLAHELGGSGAGVRVLVDAGGAVVLRSVVHYERTGAAAAAPDIEGEGIDAYVEAVARGAGLIALQPQADPRLPPALRRQFVQRHVRSLLDAALVVDGMVYGAVSCEAHESTRWTPGHMNAIRRLVARAAPTIVEVLNGQRLAPMLLP